MKQIFHNKLIQMRSPIASRQIEALTDIEQHWDDSRIRKFCTFLDHIDDAAAASIAPLLAKAANPDLLLVLCRFALRDDVFLQKITVRLLHEIPAQSRSTCAVLLLQKSTSDVVRKSACELLATSGNEGHKKILLEALSDSSPVVLQAAIHAIRELRYAPALPQLCQLLKQSRDNETTVDIINTIAVLPKSSSFPSTDLIYLMQENSEQDVREAAAFALGSTQDSRHCDALLKLLRDKTQPGELRAAAARSLTGYNTQEVIMALLMTSTQTLNIPLTLTCRQTLKNMPPETVIGMAETLLADEDIRYRMEAAILLGELALAESFNLLQKHYEHETDIVVRAALLETLGGMHKEHPEVIDIMLDAMHREPVIAYTAVSSIGENLNESILPRFINELTAINDNAYWEGALSALLLYVRSNKLPNALLSQVVALLNSSHRHEAWLAAEICGWMSMREAATHLVDALEQHTDDENLHLVAARSLMHLFQNDLLALAEWLAPDHLAPLAAVINREVDLGRTGSQLIRRLAEFCAQDYKGSIDALYACAQLEPQEFAAATDDVEPEAVTYMLRIWRELDARQKRKAPLKWDHWLTSIDPRLRRNALEFLDAESGSFYLPVIIDLATNDSDLSLRLLAREAARKITACSPDTKERSIEK